MTETSEQTARPDGVGRDQLAGAARNGAISLAGSGIAAVAGLLLNVVIGRGLGADASGTFFVAVAVLTVSATIGKLGADTGLVWALSRARALGRSGDTRRLLLVGLLPSLAAGALLAVAAYAGAPWFAARVGGAGEGARLEELIRVGAPFLLLAGPVMVLAAGLRGLGDVVAFTGVQNVAVPGLRPLLAWGAVASGLGVWGAMLAWNAPLVLGTAVAVVLVARRARRTGHPTEDGVLPPPRGRRELAVEFWRFSAPRSVTAVVEVAIVWTDVVVVAALASPRDAGIYAAASRFITTGTLAEAAMRVAMAPQINRYLTIGDRAAAGRLCGVATQWIVLASWPLYAVLALYSPEVLSLFGDDFVAGAPALALLSLAMVVVMAAGNNQTVLLMSGRTGTQLVNKSLVLTIDVVLLLMLVPRWGMYGAAGAWAVSVVLDALLVLAQVRWVVGVRIPRRVVRPAMLICAVSFVPFGLFARGWTASVAGPGGLAGAGAVSWPAAALALTASVLLFGVLLRVFAGHLEVEALREAFRAKGIRAPGIRATDAGEEDAPGRESSGREQRPIGPDRQP